MNSQDDARRRLARHLGVLEVLLDRAIAEMRSAAGELERDGRHADAGRLFRAATSIESRATAAAVEAQRT